MSDAPRRPPLYLDADACPVRDETYRVAARYGLTVHVVANSVLALPREPWIVRVLVGTGLDAADDWIAAHAGPGTIVLTADVPLAARCVKAGAAVLAFDGRPFSDSTIGLAVATRDLMQSLRETGTITGGPRPFTRADRSAFLSGLDRAVNRILRDRQRSPRAGDPHG